MMKSTLNIAVLAVTFFGSQLAIASPVAVSADQCTVILTETIVESLGTPMMTQVSIPASTLTSTVFLQGQPLITAPSAFNTSSPVASANTACETVTMTSTIVEIGKRATSIKQEPETKVVTIYPCATPLPTKIATIPYGKFSDSLGNPGTTNGNTIYGLDTPQGATAVDCCNTCWFGLTYCIAAYWYSYEGCVVNQGTVTNSQIGSGIALTNQGVTKQCPNGRIPGLTYARDSGADGRSTGDFAGPCGSSYENLA